jgi:hypothetical protein
MYNHNINFYERINKITKLNIFTGGRRIGKKSYEEEGLCDIQCTVKYLVFVSTSVIIMLSTDS